MKWAVSVLLAVALVMVSACSSKKETVSDNAISPSATKADKQTTLNDLNGRVQKVEGDIQNLHKASKNKKYTGDATVLRQSKTELAKLKKELKRLQGLTDAEFEAQRSQFETELNSLEARVTSANNQG